MSHIRAQTTRAHRLAVGLTTAGFLYLAIRIGTGFMHGGGISP